MLELGGFLLPVLALLNGLDGFIQRFRISQNRQHFKPLNLEQCRLELLKLLSRFSGGEAEVLVKAGSKHIVFDCGGYQVISRLLEGEFIDYNTAIPKEHKTRVTLSAREFAESIGRASIIINEKIKNPVKAVFEENRVSISCETPMGKVSDQMVAEVEGAPVRVGFNNKFMTDALKASEEDELVLEINTAFSPIKLLPKEGDSFTFLVMPMRLKDDNETH